MSQMKLTICVVSYNTSELTLNAVRSAAADILRSNLLKKNAEIIVVDNNSSDDSIVTLQNYIKTSTVPIRLIENKVNSGFAQANNQAIAQAKGKYILLLNSDTFVQPLSLEKMVATFEEVKDQSTATLSSHSHDIDRLGIVAGCLVNPDGTYQHQGGSYPTLVSVANHLLLLDDIPIIGKLLPSTQKHQSYQYPKDAFPQLLQKDWVGGAAMMVRREMLNEIGVLDEKIFMYGEDLEFCVRAKDHHWDIGIHPTAFITHLQSASSSNQNAVVGEFKGYLYIWAKHKPIWQRPFIQAIVRLGILLRLILFGTMGNGKKAKIYKLAWKQL